MTTIDPTAFNTNFKGNAILWAIYRDIERLPLGLRGLGYMLAGIPAPGKEAPTFDPLRAGLRDLALLAGFSAAAGLSATLAADGTVPVITLDRRDLCFTWRHRTVAPGKRRPCP